MTKIYQALERANRETFGDEQPLEPIAIAPSAQPSPASPDIASRIEGLYHATLAMLPSNRGRVVEFLSAHKGAGVSTIVSEFARLAGGVAGAVLVLDAQGDNGSLCGEYGLKPTLGLKEVLEQGRPVEDAIVRYGETHLYVSVLSTGGGAHPQIESHVFREALERLREEYEFILIEAPPAMDSPVGLALSNWADGVVMVLEAEKTRWQVADSVREAVANNGGNIVGVVLNKRRYHIPSFVYRRL